MITSFIKLHQSADNSTMTKGFETAHEFAFENEWRTLFEKVKHIE